MPVEDSGEHVLGELFAERVDVDHHADHDAVVLARSLGWRLTDVVADRDAGASISSHTASMSVLP